MKGLIETSSSTLLIVSVFNVKTDGDGSGQVSKQENLEQSPPIVGNFLWEMCQMLLTSSYEWGRELWVKTEFILISRRLKRLIKP